MELGKTLFLKLLSEASDRPRKRSHRNLHESLSDPVQRTCVALEFGTYVRPHLHPQPNKWELLVVLQGRLGVLQFDADGAVRERMELEPGGDMGAVELEPNTWHTVFPLDGDAVILDIKEGPYDPSALIHFASWSPEEGTAEVEAFLTWAEDAACGICWHPEV